jgi:hypothetical protein
MAATTAASSSAVRLIVGTALSFPEAHGAKRQRPRDRLERGLADGDADHDGSGPLVWRETAALLAERLRGNVWTQQSVGELTITAAFALTEHDAAHAQLMQFDTHAPLEELAYVPDGNRPVLKRFQKNVVKRYFGPMLSPRTALSSVRHFSFR